MENSSSQLTELPQLTPDEQARLGFDITKSSRAEIEDAQRLEHVFAPVVDPEIGGRQVTEATKEAAATELERVIHEDPEVTGILAKHVYDDSDKLDTSNPYALVDYVRESPGVRIALGELLLGRIDKIAQEGGLGDRIVDNGEKSSKIPGYPKKITSREYSALIAMSMLDGTWDKQREGSDAVVIGEDSKPELGQHRHAAQAILKK